MRLARSVTVRAIFHRSVTPPPPPLAPPPPPPPLNGTGLRSTASLATFGAPVGAAVGFGSFWLRAGTGYTMDRIDAATTTISTEIQDLPTATPGFSQPIAAGEGSIWTSNIGAGSVSRIDPATNRVVATIPVWPTNVCGPEPSLSCSAPSGIAITPGAVWVALHHEWAVVRIDPATNTVVATIPIGSSGGNLSGPSDLTAANGFVYVGGAGGLGSESFLKRIDPATNAVTPIIDLPTGCGRPAGAGTHVWIGIAGCGQGGAGTIGDIDVDSASIVGQVAVGGPPFDVTVGSGSVWTITGSNELVRIDPAAHAVTGRLPFPGTGEAHVAVGAEGIWLAIQNAVYRIEEVR